MSRGQTRTNPIRRATLATLLAAALAAPGAARAYNKTFAANSLIIPTQMEYQTDCGMVSAYGLVYTLLYKNAARVAAGQKPITIYWVIEPRKQSHHRCNTATDTLPSYGSYNEDDGCDFAIQSASGQPVALLNNDNATETAPFSVYTTSYNNSSGQISRSATQNQSIGATKKVVKYGGGLWVIDATDRAAVVATLADPLLTKYRDGGACTGLPTGAGASHQTSIHSARIGFTAPVARMMNAKPPLIALLAGSYVDILQGYLENAGLDDIPNAGGTVANHGVIYDQLYPLTDFISGSTYPIGPLNMKDPADPLTNLYQVMWAPHWEEDSDTAAGPADCASGDDACGDGVWTHNGDDYKVNAFKNIATFANDGFGIFLECASIASFEGSYAMGQAPCSNTYQCECTDSSATPACSPFGSTLPQTCPSGSSSLCGGCYSPCGAGTTLKSTPCDQMRCVPNGTECPAGASWRSGDQTCWSCNTNWTLVTPMPAAPATPQCSRPGRTNRSANSVPPNGSAPATVAGTCPGGWTTVCQAAASSIELPGFDPVRFKMTNRIVKNGLSGGAWGGSYSIPDCTDQNLPSGSKYLHAAIAGDCFDFHPTTGGPGNMFSQKGNFNLRGAMGHTSHWEPAEAVGSVYRPTVQQFVTTKNAGDATRAGWDFVTSHYKDNDPTKGMIVYLGGHNFDSDPGGNRIVLNTMLNLGFSDAGIELARSEPVGYVTWGKDGAGNPIVSAQTVFQGTYVQRAPPGPYQDWMNYNPLTPGAWRFPYIDGHLRAYNLSSISTSLQDFRTNALWDAAANLPAPGSRKLFTTLGGSANLGWKKVNWDYTQVAPATCAHPSGYTDAGGSTVCDLSYKLAQCATAGITTQQLLAGDATGAKASTLGMFVQQVRGWCSAHDKSTGAAIMSPTDSQCDNYSNKWQRNTPFLGGVDHSSPAIVGPTPYLGDTTDSSGNQLRWSTRPTVAYFGGRDGMLHAVYVSGDTGWAAQGASMPAGVHAGQELWAYLPPGQLCGLATNSAMVDANVNVMDVFGDFPRDANNDGIFDLTVAAERPTGVREWRTILVATAGEGAAELFAMDVTNPLKPVLLWHVGGPDNLDDRFDMNGNGTFADAADHMDIAQPKSYANKWYNSDDGTQGVHAWIPTDYLSTSATVLNGIKTGRYDYHNLGYAFGTAIGTIWNGNAFRFVTFLVTSAADFTNATTPLGYKGVEVFSIDVVTGQKLWQWENRYTRKNAAGNVIADNGIPGRPALVDVDSDGSVDRVYVGDFEGHVWELSATDGRNLNWLPSSAGGYKSFPLWGTPPMSSSGVDSATLAAFTAVGVGAGLAQQPLTSPIGVGRFTVVPTALQPYLKNRIAIAQGTMGVDWSIAPTQPGHVYVMPAFPEKDTRLTGTINTAAKTVDPVLSGVVLDAAIWDTQLNVGERVYGMPKIIDNQMFVNTSYGTFTGDITSSLTDAGRTLQVNAAGATANDTGQKRFGGVLVFGTELVITSDTGIIRKANVAPGGTVETRVRNRFTPTAPKSWEQKPDHQGF